MTRGLEAATSLRWDRVEKLIDISPGLQDLRAHGLQLLAARLWRRRGRVVPASLVDEEIHAAWRTHAAPHVLRLVREACDSPMLLIKGPAVAARYPEPSSRPFIDIDILVPEPHKVQDALLAAGFVLTGDPGRYPAGLHHLPPIHSPSDPIPVEVHGTLKWVDVLSAPTFDQLIVGSKGSTLGVDGIRTPASARQILILTGHLWAHDSFTTLLRLLDIAVLSQSADPAEIEALSEAWGLGRLWRLTRAVTEALFGSGTARPWPLKSWARALPAAREPTVAELHLGRLLSPFSAYPPAAALRALAGAIGGFARPQEGESWRRKLRRTARQVAHPSMRRSEHLVQIAAGPEDPGPPEASGRPRDSGEDLRS